MSFIYDHKEVGTKLILFLSPLGKKAIIESIEHELDDSSLGVVTRKLIDTQDTWLHEQIREWDIILTEDIKIRETGDTIGCLLIYILQIQH